MADLTKAYNEIFRTSMENPVVAEAFLQIHLPESIRNVLNMSSLKLEKGTYIDRKQQEVISDLVFTCHHNKGDVVESEIDNETDSEAKVVLLIEHQSTPDRFMAFRVYHYLFNILRPLLKKKQKGHMKGLLPSVYALVFYHNKQIPFPGSMDLTSSFDAPLAIMGSMSNEAVPLFDENQIPDDELQRQHLIEMVVDKMLGNRSTDINPYLPWQTGDLKSMELSDSVALNFIRTTFKDLLVVGNITDIEQFIINVQRLPESMRGDFMAAAEQLRAMGTEKGHEEDLEKDFEEGLEKGKKEVAINLLKEDVDPQFIARITGLELTAILELKEQLEEE